MPEPPFDPEALASRLQAVAQALVAYAPAHFRTAFCVAEESAKHGAGRLEYRIGSEQHPAEGTSRPSPELHDAVHEVLRFYAKHKLGFPGIEATIAANDDGSFATKCRMLHPDAEPRSEQAEQKLWDDVYGAREAFFVEHFGPLPEYIQKLMNLTGVWPGGGIFPIVAERMGGIGVCTSFGLSNADMPTPVKSAGHERRAGGGVVEFSGTLEARTPRWVAREAAGYGYEVAVLTPRPEGWALGPVSWLVQMELVKDVELLDRVDEMGGVTIEALDIGGGRQADFLVAPAQPPLPAGAELPNGTMRLLVATRITRDEMDFARTSGRKALLERLVAAGVGQTSDLGRRSVLTR
jgi:hypothetical protein